MGVEHKRQPRAQTEVKLSRGKVGIEQDQRVVPPKQHRLLLLYPPIRIAKKVRARGDK